MKIITLSLFFLVNSLYCEVIKDLKVKWVVDGDTVHATKEGKLYKIRLTEIDAPERDQPYGGESTQLLKQLLEDGYFDVDISGIDIYERHLGRLYDNGVDINREMVEQGLAWVYDKYVTDKSFYENQSSAQKNNRGLWQNPESIAPWYWRQRGRAE